MPPLGRIGTLASTVGEDVDLFRRRRLAEVAVAPRPARSPRSARAVHSKSLRRIVTKVVRTKSFAQIEIQAGPHRFVSLITP